MMYNLFCINLSLFQPPTITVGDVLHTHKVKVADWCVPQAQSLCSCPLLSANLSTYHGKNGPPPPNWLPRTNYKNPLKLILLQNMDSPWKIWDQLPQMKKKNERRPWTYFTCKIWTSGLWGFWKLLRHVSSAAQNCSLIPSRTTHSIHFGWFLRVPSLHPPVFLQKTLVYIGMWGMPWPHTHADTVRGSEKIRCHSLRTWWDSTVLANLTVCKALLLLQLVLHNLERGVATE